MSQTMPPVGGRYELRRQLAAGPAARVYVAHDLQLGRPVALKVLGPDLARDPAIVDKFRQAASTAASVHDPRIVTIYDWGDDQGAVYVAMELVDGTSLAETVAAGRRLGVDQTISIGIGVAQALDAAHRGGLVHGSLTPRDVLLARDGSVKVTDFGTATAGLAALGDTTEQAAYDSPEQLQGGAPDARSDLYALGGVMYLAATGAPPFHGSDVVALTQRKLSEPAVPPSAVAAGIPPGFDVVVERLLDRDPTRRYPSASDAATELRRLQETIQVPLTAAPITATATAVAPVATPVPAAPPPEPERKSSTGWIVAAIIILALAIGGVVAWLVLQDDDDSGSKDQAIVPAVVGLTLERAQASIQAEGLDSSTVTENNADFGPGIVFSQAPQPTTSVPKGSVVVLKVSAGPTTTTSTSTTTSSTTTSTTSTTTTTTTTTAPPTSSST